MAVSEKLRKKLLKRKDDLKKGTGDFKTIFFKEGTTRVRPLFVGEDEDFAQEAMQFFVDGESIISPATFGEPCAMMEAYQELRTGDDDEKALAKSISPSKRYYTPAIKYTDDTGKEVEGDPKLAILTKGIYETLIEFMLDEEQGDFTDPTEGYDLKIVRTGKGKMDTEYKVVPCKPTKLPKELAKKVFSPEEMIRELLPSYEKTQEMIEKLLGIVNASEDDDDDIPTVKKKKATSDLDDDAPAPKKALKKRKLKK